MLVGMAMDTKAMTTLSSADGAFLSALGVGIWLTAGVLIGGFHFLTLQWNVQWFTTGEYPLLALAIQLMRFVVIAGVLAIIACRFGAMPLLIATAGILAARTAVIRGGAQ
jgi:F1F0 ATPase subunit 2